MSTVTLAEDFPTSIFSHPPIATSFPVEDHLNKLRAPSSSSFSSSSSWRKSKQPVLFSLNVEGRYQSKTWIFVGTWEQIVR